ncbi:hypothetical protein AB0E54_29120, partial [Amycolatopsis coloradensis]|uniref:hypothetical protein n=1 Tax=Amycolatopsis coloradensis TaxID=76021 RepID=UPI003402E989
IGQTMINVKTAGARTRLSTFLAGDRAEGTRQHRADQRWFLRDVWCPESGFRDTWVGDTRPDGSAQRLGRASAGRGVSGQNALTAREIRPNGRRCTLVA